MTTDTSSPVLGTIWHVSVRDDLDRSAVLVDALTYIGVIPGCAPGDVTAPESFRDAGYTTTDAVEVLTTITELAGDPDRYKAHAIGLRTSDYEGRATSMFMVPETHVPSFERVEPMLATWPNVFDVLGVTLSGVKIHADNTSTTFTTRTEGVPKSIRLKSGWDYDGAGNRIELSLDEACRRLVAHDDGRRDTEALATVRGHMEEIYAAEAPWT